MTDTTTDAVRIAQGARSEARIETIDGRLCVTKRYNDYRGSPKVKLTRELAFYHAYAAVPILPKLVAYREPDTITVTHVAGKRLIDVIESGASADTIRAVSANYGVVLAQFFGSSESQDEAAARSHIAATVDRTNATLKRHPHWKSASVRRALAGLGALADAAPPMMCKTDWSASNMLVRGDTITCLYDFDTAYPGNRLTFLGDILGSASIRLDWPAVRAGLTSAGVAMPAPESLATAAHFSRWQVQLARASDHDLGWPGAERFGDHLERLTALAQS